jgi:hypothetical protein
MRQGLVDSVLTALVNESQRLRGRWTGSKEDGRYKDEKRLSRVNLALSEGRLNILLIGYGETYEPPVTTAAGVYLASFSLVSYNVAFGEVTIFSFTHDIRAPEIERATRLIPRGVGTARRMGDAYLAKVDGVSPFDLSREVIEDATGLSVDFVVAFDDSILADVVDRILGGVTIDVPESFDVHGFRLGNVLYDKVGHFDKGVQTLSGVRVIQYIKTVPVAAGAYPRELEHNVRKHQVFQAILTGLGKKCGSKFWVDSGWALAGMVKDGRVKADFDLVSMLTVNLSSVPGFVQDLLQGDCRGVNLPGIKDTKYIVDPAHGDGGVQWITANSAFNPITRKDIDTKVYSGLDVEIPAGGEFVANPYVLDRDSRAVGYSDFSAQYWVPVRELVKAALK